MDNSDTTSNLLDDDILDWNTIAIIDSAASSYGSGFQASLPIPSQLDDEVASLKSNRSDGSLVDPQVLPPELANNGDTRAFRENASPAFIDSEASLIPKGEAHEPRVTSILDAQLYQGGQPCPPNLQNKVRYGDPACSSQVLDVAKMVSTCVKSEMLSQHFPSTRASSNSQESLTRTDSAAGSTISSNASEGQQLSSVPPLQKRSFTASNAESQGTSKRRKVFSTEAVERRLTNIHIGLQQREEDDFQRPIVRCRFNVCSMMSREDVYYHYRSMNSNTREAWKNPLLFLLAIPGRLRAWKAKMPIRSRSGKLPGSATVHVLSVHLPLLPLPRLTDSSLNFRGSSISNMFLLVRSLNACSSFTADGGHSRGIDRFPSNSGISWLSNSMTITVWTRIGSSPGNTCVPYSACGQYLTRSLNAERLSVQYTSTLLIYSNIIVQVDLYPPSPHFPNCSITPKPPENSSLEKKPKRAAFLSSCCVTSSSSRDTSVEQIWLPRLSYLHGPHHSTLCTVSKGSSRLPSPSIPQSNPEIHPRAYLSFSTGWRNCSCRWRLRVFT
ncbi:unnamed protein product [Somion occarium]|uniref:Uncharacterized protein n=1 Tax=Somion occarium TaxID=3059160 RepID=A0ABP1CXN1_9APHY